MALASASVYMAQLLPKEVCVWIRLRKPIHRPGWWKGNFALFQILATVGWWAICPKANPPSQLPTSKGPRAFIGRSGGQLPAETAHLLTSLTVIFRLVLTSITLAVLGTVTLQFQGPFVPVSLQPNLGTAAAHVLGIVGCQVVNFSTWCFCIYKRVHRIWLRILSIALEKELKVLDYAS